MNIGRNEKINIIKDELVKIRRDLINIKLWEKEIKLIDEKINSYGDINYNEIGFKSKNTFTLEDILRKDENRKEILESKIFYAKYKSKLKDYEMYINLLEEDKQKVIKEIYIKNLEKKKVSFRIVAQITKFSKSQVERFHKEALEDIYNKKFGNS